ncbi:SDR family NAD(P)-dependent oxidoreductase [Streptomyces sp. NPDC127098]|uniref:SDR family NAD(P)-dependent oxidoreductase n=1 Tax=Streptomyces sp. NPDC127098 TaxID=3347137 RepID=UPI0036464099
MTASHLALAGRRLLVTGGSRGLGASIVRALTSAGASVATCGRRTEHLEALVASLPEASLFTRRLDIAEPGHLESFVADAADSLGGLDGVVACAGGARGRALEESTAEDWEATWQLNVGHAARLTRSAAPVLRAAGGGSVVFISSISGWRPSPQAQYGTAKAGLIYLATVLARELGPQGIRVNTVSPGSMLIPGKRWDRMRQEEPDAYQRFLRETPGGRLVTPEEVAQVVAFLLSDMSSGISGAHIPVDRAQNAPTPEGY